MTFRGLGTVVLVLAVSAQDPAPQSPQGQPTFRGGARFVRVDVYPTGGDGRPVEGLTAADFELYEDGTPQTIAPAVLLGSPGTSAVDPTAVSGGLKLFGYTVMPKLNFGLELLYGDGEPQLDLQQGGPSFEDENRDVTVLGKVKRRF